MLPVLVRLLTLALLFFAGPTDAAAAPKRALLLHSFGQDFPPWSEYSKHLRLQRWAIEESNLPGGSTIAFREPTFWEQHGWTVIGVLSIVLVQAAMISALLFERVRRQQAETASRRRLLELTQMNRSLTASAMSSSIAHELNQPLGAILNNVKCRAIVAGKGSLSRS